MFNHRIFILLLLLAAVLSACTSDEIPTATAVPQEQIEHIRLPMGYIPNIQYAPFYVADHLGFFELAGIEIEFDYSYETDGVALVGANELQFSLVSGEQVLLARDQGLPVVYVLGWYGEYPVGVVSKTEQGITTPEDLAGKRIGLPGLFGANYIGLRALLDAGGLTESDVTLDAIGFNQVEALATDQEQAVAIYVANEPIQLQAQGYDVDVLAVADYVHLVSNGLLTNETTIKEYPELVIRMTQPITSGIRYVINHPEEAYEISKLYVEGLEDADSDVQMAVLKASIELYQQDPVGHSNLEAWQNMQDVLLDMDLLSEPLDLEAAFTNDLIRYDPDNP
jgi:NitT/TauT family transport system substrate-binding protein